MVLALLIAICTGQRQADVLRMSWHDYENGTIQVTQDKTGEKVWIPAHVDLRSILEQLPRHSPIMLTTRSGRPFKPDHFRHEWRKAILAAGLNGLTFHGLRHTAAERLAEAGCTDQEIAAVTGHRSAAMVRHYTRQANKRKLARAAIAKLEKNQ
jgi:integrase